MKRVICYGDSNTYGYHPDRLSELRCSNSPKLKNVIGMIQKKRISKRINFKRLENLKQETFLGKIDAL